MSNNELIKRREAYAKGMEKNSFSLLYAGKSLYKSKDQTFPFTTNKNFFYLTGLRREKFILLIRNAEASHFEFLFIEEPSDYATKWLGSRMTKEEASKVSGIDPSNIFYLNDFEAFVAGRILMDSRVAIAKLPENLYLDLFRQYTMTKPNSLEVFHNIIETYPELAIKDACGILDNIRRLKSDSEVLEISKAIEYTNKGIQAMMKAVKPGVNERELEALFEFSIKVAGSEGTSFNTICASGKNATILHYESNDQVIEDNTLLLTDLGALSNNYSADITRTYPANGKFTERQKQLYQLVLDVNKEIISLVKPGIFLGDLNTKANELLAEKMIKLGKIKTKEELHKYYYHSIGHYLGIDVHDVGTYKTKLEPGVIITVEPGIYVSDEGIGIRIEDDVLVTKDGHINLSSAIIKEIDEIEAFMKK
ncbi:MAG: aminopeptidase P family protein [Tenericutes bacterium]|nr:aminopeptidase P family protein [Mycoplasmatota bacterium]